MSARDTEVDLDSAPYAEEKLFSTDEKPSESSRDPPSGDDKHEAAHSAPSDAGSDVPLVNDGNPFPEDPNAPEETNQLTVRAIVVGSVLGLIVGASNVYLGLKTGMWSPRSTPPQRSG